MQGLIDLVSALSWIIAIGAVARLMLLGFSIMFNPYEKQQYVVKIKNVVLTLIISVVVGFSGPFTKLIQYYFQG